MTSESNSSAEQKGVDSGSSDASAKFQDMTKSVQTKSDGRTVIFYSFKTQKSQEKQNSDLDSPNTSTKGVQT
jgi:hypothetical protein